MLLSNKNIVIVGGTSGIGFSAASAFVNEGANVIAIGRKPDRITKTQKILGNHGTAIQGNAADSTTAQEGIQLAVDEYGSLHGLYHVAGADRIIDGIKCDSMLELQLSTYPITSLMNTRGTIITPDIKLAGMALSVTYLPANEYISLASMQPGVFNAADRLSLGFCLDISNIQYDIYAVRGMPKTQHILAKRIERAAKYALRCAHRVVSDKATVTYDIGGSFIGGLSEVAPEEGAQKISEQYVETINRTRKEKQWLHRGVASLSNFRVTVKLNN